MQGVDGPLPLLEGDKRQEHSGRNSKKCLGVTTMAMQHTCVRRDVYLSLQCALIIYSYMLAAYSWIWVQ